MVPTWVWVVVLVAGSLAPFAGRAFHIDDPLFLWTARQVLAAPAHFYGFKLNWSGLEMQMTDVMCNPPGMAFFLAAAASVVGWREFALHAACLLPAIAAGLGVLQLARSFCSRPLFAVVLTVLTPGFLVCGTSVMCDVAMLACWVWALVLWERGLTSGRYGDFLGAGVLAALCGLMKYSGLSVVPLLLAWGAVRQRRLGRWAFALLIPVAMLGAYEALAYWAHGAFLFGNAAAYAREVRPFSLGELPDRLLIGLTFAGGCALPALALAPCVWSRRALAAGAALFLVILAGPRVFDAAQLALTGQGFGVQALWQNGWQTWKGIWPLETQRALWLMGGLSVGALAIADWRRHRDPMSAVLGVWTLGVLAFASLLNWTINGRSVLPMLPVVGILLARRLEEGAAWRTGARRAMLAVCLGLAALGAFAVAEADGRLANVAREAAGRLAAKYGGQRATLWFVGHWGFQYYLQGTGAKPLDMLGSALAPGDVIVVPSSQAGGYDPPAEATTLAEVVQVGGSSWLSTMDRSVGAGFHSDFWGPLPYAVGAIEPERCYVFRVVRPFKYNSWAPVIEPGNAGTPQEELSKLEAKLRVNPGDVDSRFQSALVRMSQSQVPEAVAALQEVLKVHPDSFRAHLELASLYAAAGNDRAACEHYQAALQRVPDFSGGLNNLAWLLATAADPSVRDGVDAAKEPNGAGDAGGGVCEGRAFQRCHPHGGTGAGPGDGGQPAAGRRKEPPAAGTLPRGQALSRAALKR
jgi:hypothetical protein